MKIKIRYNGRRFPRFIPLRKRGTTSFQKNRTVLELEEYDALHILNSNNRLNINKWEFTVENVIKSRLEQIQKEEESRRSKNISYSQHTTDNDYKKITSESNKKNSEETETKKKRGRPKKFVD